MTKPKKTDFETIQAITSKIVLLMSEMLEEIASIKDDAQATQKNLQDVLFGGRNSIISSLNTTTDLLVKLEKLKPEIKPEKKDPLEDMLSPQDFSIVQNFIKRKKAEEEQLRNRNATYQADSDIPSKETGGMI